MTLERATTSGRRVLRDNIIANSLGRIWQLLANIAFVPVYIAYLGATSYGLVVFQVTLFASLQVLDSGLSSALSRELSLRLAPGAGGRIDARSAVNLVRTVEILSITMAVLIGVAVALAAPVIATSWLHGEGLDPRQATWAVRLMGAVVAVQWPTIAYQAALSGLQQQVGLNKVRMVTSTVQALGLVGVLAWISATPRAYFIWMLLVQTLNTIWLRSTLWRSLDVPGAAKPRFDWREVLAVWRFAAGMAGIAFLGGILGQIDKIVLSRMLPLSDFGAYGVAYSICSVLSSMANPVFSAAVPRFTQLIGMRDPARLRTLYLSMCELVALMIVPGWLVLVCHSDALMRLWMGTGREAVTIAGLLPLIATGWLINGLVTLPLGLQVASGWTSLSLCKNVIAVALVIPALLLVVPRHGAAGAAMVWLALNMGYLLLEIPIMHRRVLRGTAVTWYVRAVAAPLAVATAVGVASKGLLGADSSAAGSLAGLLGSAAVTVVILSALLPSLRHTLMQPVLTRLTSGRS